METEQWTVTVDESELKEDTPLTVKVGNREILLVRVGHRILACGAKCTHYGAPLAEGILVNHVVTCPWHTSTFDLATGQVILPPALDHLPACPVKVENGRVYVGPPATVPFPKVTLREHPVFVILGAGAAGNAAAETLRREGFEGQIVMVTAESDRPYDRPNLSKQYMAGTAKPEWIPLRSEKFYSLHHIDLLTDHRVTAVDPDSKHLTFENGNTLAYDRLLLATGGRPRNLDVPGTHLKGYFLLRSWADANTIIASLQNTQTAVVVGTGFIGMEVAASLKARNLSVHVVGKEESPMKFPFGDRVSNYLKRMHEEKGVVFHLGTTLKEIVGQNRVDEVVLADGTRIKTDIVIAGLGIVPAVEYLRNTDLVVDGAVPVDPCLRTKAKDIFAAGDIALVPTPPGGTPLRVEHWVVAERLGQHAARTMLGSDAAYDEIPFFWTRQYDNSLQYVGHAAEFDRIAYRGDPDSGKFLAGYYLNGSLKAVAGMKMNKEFLHLGRMLKANITISPDHFENEEFSLTDIAQLV